MNSNPNITKSKRIFYFDQLRALAIIGVIVHHVASRFTKVASTIPGTKISILFTILPLAAVPLFFTISGALLLNREYSIPDFFKRRFSRILIPFIFWVIIYIIFGVLVLHADFSLVYSLKIFLGKGVHVASGILGGAFWFVWTLIGIYLFLPVLNDFIQKRGLKGAEYFLIIWFIMLIVGTFKLPTFFLDLSFFAGWIGFPVLGYYLANKKFKLSNNKMLLLSLVIFLLTTILFCFFRFNPLIIMGYKMIMSKLNFLLALQIIGLFLTFRYLNESKNNIVSKVSNFIENKLGSLTNTISRYSYGIYLVHMIFLNLIWIYLFDLTKLNTTLGIVITSALVLLLSWLSLWVLNKIPGLKKITGAN